MHDEAKIGRPLSASYVLRLDIFEALRSEKKSPDIQGLFLEPGADTKPNLDVSKRTVQKALEPKPASKKTAKALADFLKIKDYYWLLDHSHVLKQPVSLYLDGSLPPLEEDDILYAHDVDECESYRLARSKSSKDLPKSVSIYPIEDGQVMPAYGGNPNTETGVFYRRWDRRIVFDEIEQLNANEEICIYSSYPAEANDLNRSLRIWLDRVLAEQPSVTPRIKVLYMPKDDPLRLAYRMRLREDCDVAEHLEKCAHAYKRMNALQKDYRNKADIKFYSHHSHVYSHFYILGERVIFAADMWPDICSTHGTMEVIDNPHSTRWKRFRESFDCVYTDAIKHCENSKPNTDHAINPSHYSKKVNYAPRGKKRVHPGQFSLNLEFCP